MSRAYQFMYFKKADLCIRVIYLRKPIVIGALQMALAGYTQCPTLEGRVSLMVDYRDRDSLTYDFACAAVGSDGRIRVLMEPETYLDFVRGKPYARTTILHELGHIHNGDLRDPAFTSDQYDEERLSSIQDGQVEKRELRADDFAADLLGTDYVAKGLSEIRDRISVFIESEYEDTVAELNLRIARFNDTVLIE